MKTTANHPPHVPLRRMILLVFMLGAVATCAADKNNNDVEAGEKKAVEAWKAKIDGYFKSNDKDKDGKINLLEFDPSQIPIKGPKLPKKGLFEKLDADKDGKLSLTELRLESGMVPLSGPKVPTSTTPTTPQIPLNGQKYPPPPGAVIKKSEKNMEKSEVKTKPDGADQSKK